MTTDHIRTAADEMDEDGYTPAQFLLVAWDGKGVIRHYMTPRVGQDVMDHVADYRKALMQLNGAPGQLATASSSSSSRKDQNVYGAMARGSGGAEPRADTAGAIARAARQLADAMGASEPGVLLDLQLVTTEVTKVGDPLPRFLYDIAISSRVVTN